jgi:hypothetical protein
MLRGHWEALGCKASHIKREAQQKYDTMVGGRYDMREQRPVSDWRFYSVVG